MKKEILEGARHCINTFENCFPCLLDCGETSCVQVFAKAIIEQHERYRWHDLRKNSDDLPPNEEVVEIAFVNSYTDKYYTARAFYEDGTMHSEDSIFGGDLWEWCEYDENTDDYILPSGWFEHVMFGEFYTEINGKFIIAWREIEPYDPEDHCPNDYHGGEC